jgi:hypothetical protein
MDTTETNEKVEKEPAPVKRMTTKEELVNNIREWIKIDNDLINLKKEIKGSL